jgi:hypothetical protein
MVTIRAATATDLPALAHLWHEKMVLQADHRTAPAADARAGWVSAAQTWLEDARCGFFAAERDGVLVAYIVGWVQPLAGLTPSHVGLITDIAIDAHGYHGGVGRGLVDALRGWFVGREVQQMVVWAAHYDAVAQAFWRSLGAADWVDVLWIK